MRYELAACAFQYALIWASARSKSGSLLTVESTGARNLKGLSVLRRMTICADMLSREFVTLISMPAISSQVHECLKKSDRVLRPVVVSSVRAIMLSKHTGAATAPKTPKVIAGPGASRNATTTARTSEATPTRVKPRKTLFCATWNEMFSTERH